jgi:hypothetical protein
MPQLDRLAYESQVIWLIVVFIGMYLLLLKTGLPKLYKILRYRQEKLLGLHKDVLRQEREYFYINRMDEQVMLRFLQVIKPLLGSFLRVVEGDVEKRRSEEKHGNSRLREVITYRELDIVNDLVTCKLLEENKYAKKGVAEKKIVGN